MDVTISIKDVNDKPPMFVPTDSINVSLSESAVAGAFVTTVQTRDGDITSQNQQVNYSLLTNPLGAFQIDSQKGNSLR